MTSQGNGNFRCPTEEPWLAHRLPYRDRQHEGPHRWRRHPARGDAVRPLPYCFGVKVAVSLPCHANGGMCESGHLLEMNQPCMSLTTSNLRFPTCASAIAGIYARRYKKVETQYNGLSRHRFQAFAHITHAGMTYLLRPVNNLFQKQLPPFQKMLYLCRGFQSKGLIVQGIERKFPKL